MGNESGEWIMRGVSWSDPGCIRSVDEASAYIERVGFLTLFRNNIDGFSLEEHTAPDFWWTGDTERDPWEWREILARRHEVAYGKFFDKKAGFISRKWLPYFANCRRDGYDFDALWDDAKASARQKKIMDLYAGERSDAEYYSFELKEKAGFGRQGEKGFEGVLTALQTEMYLCVSDFRQRTNRRGEPYGWHIALYSTPERLWGYDLVTSAYGESPDTSAGRIAAHMAERWPAASKRQIRSVLGTKAAGRKEPERPAGEA